MSKKTNFNEKFLLFFVGAAQAVIRTLSLPIKLMRHKFTVMVVPHSEKKILNFRISFLSITFFLGLFIFVVSAFIYLVSGYSGLTVSLEAKTKSLVQTREEIDSLLKEMAELRPVIDNFNQTVNSTVSSLNLAQPLDNGQNFLSGDLKSFLWMQTEEGGQLREISELRALGSTLENSENYLKNIAGLVAGQKNLLTDLPTQWPVDKGVGIITTLFGPSEHPFTRDWYLHKGIDIAYKIGQPILAAANGKVIDRNYDPGYGYNLVIRHKYGFQTKYAHMRSNIIVDIGEDIVQGQLIGYMGNSGLSTGPHLHFEIRIGTQIIDPQRFLAVKKSNQRYIVGNKKQ